MNNIIIIFLIILLMIFPIFGLLFAYKIDEKMPNNNIVLKRIVEVVIVIISFVIPVICFILMIVPNINGDIEKLIIYISLLFLYVVMWLSRTNVYFDSLIRKILNLKNIFNFTIKLLISVVLYIKLTKCLYNNFVLNYNKSNDVVHYIQLFVMITVLILLISLIINGLKHCKSISKFIDLIDCIDFIYILSLNTLLLSISNTEKIYPVLMFTIIITIYSDRKRIIKYYFGGQDEE